jgi:hypothetical protein
MLLNNLKADEILEPTIVQTLKIIKDELIRIHSMLVNPSYDISNEFNNLKNRLEHAYNVFISAKELREKINYYNKAFKDEINIFIKRKRTNLLLGWVFFVLTIGVVGLLIALAVCNFPFPCSFNWPWNWPIISSCDSKTYAKKIIGIISEMNNKEVKINHSLIYFLPKLLYVSCLLFLINICYNNYSFHKNLANLYRDKMDMANQLLALLEARQDTKERETILNKMLEILTKDREFGVKNYGTGLGINSTLPINFAPNTKQS